MSRFVCNLCNREFTTKYGLQKHSNKKISCTANKNIIYQYTCCNKILSSKKNLNTHIYNHKFDDIKLKNIKGIKNIEIEGIKNIEENNNLGINILPNNIIEITIEKYNFLKNEMNELKSKLDKEKDKLNKANDEIKQLKNEQIRLNSQINIVPFSDIHIDPIYINGSYKDQKSPLYIFSKKFNKL